MPCTRTVSFMRNLRTLRIARLSRKGSDGTAIQGKSRILVAQKAIIRFPQPTVPTRGQNTNHRRTPHSIMMRRAAIMAKELISSENEGPANAEWELLTDREKALIEQLQKGGKKKYA